MSQTLNQMCNTIYQLKVPFKNRTAYNNYVWRQRTTTNQRNTIGPGSIWFLMDTCGILLMFNWTATQCGPTWVTASSRSCRSGCSSPGRSSPCTESVETLPPNGSGLHDTTWRSPAGNTATKGANSNTCDVTTIKFYWPLMLKHTDCVQKIYSLQMFWRCCTYGSLHLSL